jgi:hypothetical protein
MVLILRVISTTTSWILLKTYGLDSFQEVAYMLLDKNINEEWFTKINPAKQIGD